MVDSSGTPHGGLDMFDAITRGLGPQPPGPEPPVAPAAAAEPVRTVERSVWQGSSDNASLARDGYSPSRAVLELLRRSAEDFQSIIETTGNPAAAVAITGTASAPPAALGAAVDEYA